MKKIAIDNEQIKYFLVNDEGKIMETGENDAERDTFEDSFIDMDKLRVGELPTISFNKGIYERRGNPIPPVWTQLNYNVVSIENVNTKEEVK